MANFQAHYKELFRELQAEHGKIDDLTLSSIVGFGEGGPVSLSTIASQKIYVTCELSVYQEQFASTEGTNYELLVRGWLNEPLCRELLTALGNLSMSVELGHDHTIDVSGVTLAEHVGVVRLREYSRSLIGGRSYGIYEVLEADGA